MPGHVNLICAGRASAIFRGAHELAAVDQGYGAQARPACSRGEVARTSFAGALRPGPHVDRGDSLRAPPRGANLPPRTPALGLLAISTAPYPCFFDFMMDELRSPRAAGSV